MVKGCQRRIIMLRGTGSGMFEEAYFILKPEKAAASEQLMIMEANRIIEENAFSSPAQHLSGKRIGRRRGFPRRTLHWRGPGRAFVVDFRLSRRAGKICP